jgi:hypothetical protein
MWILVEWNFSRFHNVIGEKLIVMAGGYQDEFGVEKKQETTQVCLLFLILMFSNSKLSCKN